MNNKLKLINKLEKQIDTLISIQGEIKNEDMSVDELSYLLQLSNELLHNCKLQYFTKQDFNLTSLNETWSNYFESYTDDIRKHNVRYTDVKKIIKEKIFNSNE